jgi:hypothetical protein
VSKFEMVHSSRRILAAAGEPARRFIHTRRAIRN